MIFGEGAIRMMPDHVVTAYVLILNPMRGRMEESRVIAASEIRDELVKFVEGERVEPYTTVAASSFDSNPHTFRHVYREGPLQWFNPPSDLASPADDWGHGIITVKRDGWRRIA